MKVLLFDLHDAGYHLEFGSEIVDALHDPDAGLTVDLLTTDVTDRHEQLFPAERLIEAPAFAPGTDDRGTDAYRRAAVDAAFRVAREGDYDLLHFVEIDDVLEYLYQHAENDRTGPAVVGTLDGGRFFRNTRRHRIVSAAMGTEPGASLLRGIHRAALGEREQAQLLKNWLYAASTRVAGATSYADRFDRALFEDVLASLLSPPMLENCIDAGALDRLVVKSIEAAEYVRDMDPAFATERLVYVPDTLELWTDLPDQETARERLGIDADRTVLLQFGELRHEKGVDVLLEALSGYDGPPFTLVLAGKPVDVTAEDVQAAKRRTSVPIHDVLSFIPDGDVPLYYAAADGLVVPYRPAFGLRRTSGPFLKACGAGKPILAPAFGVFDRQIRDRDLGLTFVPEDADDLRRKLARFASDPAATYDAESMRTFASERTFERVAEELRAVYENATEDSVTD
ncbi:glycosyltransferase [Halapricum hydrolyticum]|uniref:Glycosyltransferase n=1 Tax=Halapricum hydrolyticum TaxID=2979991 RepID=A0AAE3LEG6_9EURY|nr:glycosyltransferase [Halapricum hydrolyticum]MCU4718213.1 glycosyltransferase [Halapricum hydrolyticum]MCU4726346.1 glycosyltransferase [Halapricum hydrolyticum]